VFLFFSVARSLEIGSWERATEGTHGDKAKTAKHAGFGTNMPLMSSAFDTAMWRNAA
jgi:hypothetical protein